MSIPGLRQSFDQAMTFSNTLQSNKYIRTAQGHLPCPALQKVNPNSKKGKDYKDTNLQNQSLALPHQFSNSVTRRPFNSIFHEPMNGHAKLGYEQETTDGRSRRHSYAQQDSAHRLSLTSLVRPLAQSVPIRNGDGETMEGYKGSDEQSMRDSSIHASRKQFNFNPRATFEGNSTNQTHHMITPYGYRPVCKIEGLKRKPLMNPSQFQHPSKYARINNHGTNIRTTSANPDHSVSGLEVIDLSQGAKEMEQQVVTKLRGDVREDRAWNESVRVLQGVSRMANRNGKTRVVKTVDERSLRDQRQHLVSYSSPGLKIPVAPNQSGYISDMNEEHSVSGSYSSYHGADANLTRYSQTPGKRVHSIQNPISPRLTARHPDSPLENRKESKHLQVDVITQTPRIPRYVKVPRSILKKTGPFVADDSTDNEECYTVVNSPRRHLPVQSATQTVGFEHSALPNQTKLDDIYDEQNSSIVTEKFNTYQPDRGGAATSRALRHQAQLQRRDHYGIPLKGSKNPPHQTPKEEGSAHGSLKILSGAHVGANKIVPREHSSRLHIPVQADSPTSSPINDELALEAKKSCSPPPPNTPGSSGVLASNAGPVIPENAMPLQTSSASEPSVGFNSYFTTHSQLKKCEQLQRKRYDIKDALKAKFINMQLMSQNMKAVKERAQAKNRADSRAVGKNLFKPAAEKGLGNNTLTKVAVQPDRSSRTACHDDNSDSSDLDEEFANVPDLTKIRIYAEGTAKPRESNHTTSLEKRAKGTFNIITPFGSAHSQDSMSIHSVSNEPLPTCPTRKRPKITEGNTGEESLYGACKRKQLAQGKQKSGHVSQERDDISPNLSGTPGRKPHKATMNGQRVPLDPYCNNDQIKDREPPLLPKASQTLQAEGENTSAIQTEWADVDPLVQTQTRHSSVVSDAEECREISKEKELQEKLTLAEKESSKQKDREDRIARSRDRQRELEFRLREMTNVGEKSETKEHRRQEREAEQEQVIQKMNVAEENHQEEAKLIHKEKKQTDPDTSRKKKYTSQQIRDIHRRNAQRRLNPDSEATSRGVKSTAVVLGVTNPFEKSLTKSKGQQCNAKVSKAPSYSTLRDGPIRKPGIDATHGRDSKPSRHKSARPIAIPVYEIHNELGVSSQVGTKELEPQDIATLESVSTGPIHPAGKDTNKAIQARKALGRPLLSEKQHIAEYENGRCEMPQADSAPRPSESILITTIDNVSRVTEMTAAARLLMPANEVPAKISDEDRLIVKWRDRPMKWQEVEGLWNRKMGKALTKSGLQKRYKKAKDILGETAISSSRSSSEPPNSPRAIDVEDALYLQKHPDNSTQTKGVRKALVEYSEDSDSDSDESRASIREGQPTRLKQNTVTVNQPPYSDTAHLTQERISAPVPGSASSPVVVPYYETTLDATALARPTVGGKTYNMKALEAHLEFMREGQDTDSEAELDSGDEQENSSITSDDCCHWEYQVKRKTWAHNENEEDIPYAVCGSLSYTALGDANMAASQEALKERNGVAIGPYTRQWMFTSHPTGMVEYNATCAVGNFKIVVDRFLRNATDGILPTSKAGWLHKQVYDLKRKTTIKAPKPDGVDDLFEDVPTENDLVTNEQFDIYTILDEANREAGRLVLDLKTDKHSKRLDDVLKWMEESQRIRAKTDDLEQMKEMFREKVTVDDRRVVEIWVEERSLKGPRNI